MAYVLGYFAADGCMIENKRGAHFIEFVSTDKILVDQVQRVVMSNHSISLRERGKNAKTAFRLQIGSKEWFNDLTELGFTTSKSNTLHFPSVPPRFLGDFVRGYFDGDGCVYFKEHWSKWHRKNVWVLTTRFTSGSKAFLAGLHNELRDRGLSGGYYNLKKKGAYDLVFSRRDSLALYRLMYNTAEVPDLFLPRKREKLERAIQVLGLDTKVRS